MSCVASKREYSRRRRAANGRSLACPISVLTGIAVCSILPDVLWRGRFRERHCDVPRHDHLTRPDPHPAVLDDEIDLLQVVEVLVGPSVNDNDIRQFAGLEASELVVHVEQFGVRHGRGLERLRDRVAALHEPLELSDVHGGNEPVCSTNSVRADPQHDPGRFHLLEEVEVRLRTHRAPPGGRAIVAPRFVEDILVHLQGWDRANLALGHLRDRLVGPWQRMLDGVDAGLYRHGRIDGLAIARDLQAEQVRLVDRRRHLLSGEMTGDLDDARAFLEGLADGGAPRIWTIHFPGELWSMVRVTGRSVAWPPVPVMMWPPVNTRGAGMALAALHSLSR